MKLISCYVIFAGAVFSPSAQVALCHHCFHCCRYCNRMHHNAFHGHQESGIDSVKINSWVHRKWLIRFRLRLQSQVSVRDATDGAKRHNPHCQRHGPAAQHPTLGPGRLRWVPELSEPDAVDALHLITPHRAQPKQTLCSSTAVSSTCPYWTKGGLI
jgi:hypothetical protein